MQIDDKFRLSNALPVGLLIFKRVNSFFLPYFSHIRSLRACTMKEKSERASRLTSYRIKIIKTDQMSQPLDMSNPKFNVLTTRLRLALNRLFIGKLE